MEDQVSIIIQDEFPDTHFFIYKKKKYPIKSQFFYLSSQYFIRNKVEIEYDKNIYLVDNEKENDINISEEQICTFINFVQHKRITLNKENVVALNYLSNRFEVCSLIDITNEYILKHQQELVLDILLLKKDSSMENKAMYENIIAQNIQNYINDERFLSLDIMEIYRKTS